MFSRIFIDHIYNADPGHSFFKKLGKMGFILSEDKVEHPGKLHCRFIPFKSCNSREVFYLEFVRVGKGGKAYKKPGLSFGYSKNLKQFHKKISSKIETIYHHKNYDWKKNNIDSLPGWNFVSFKNFPVRSFYTWFTEYEPRKNRRRPKLYNHPNKVIGLYGIELTLSEKGKASLEKILGKKLKSKTRLSDGTFLYINKGRTNRFENVILKSNDLKTTEKFIKDGIRSEFDKLKAIRINNINRESKMWSIIIIEA